MRVALVIGLLAAAVMLVGAAQGERTAAGKPALTLKRSVPLTARGTSFVPGERVRVSVAAERRLVKRTIANRRGGFVVRFQTPVNRCLGLSAVAVGDKGSVAKAQSPAFICVRRP
jgi:hypothetical protein